MDQNIANTTPSCPDAFSFNGMIHILERSAIPCAVKSKNHVFLFVNRAFETLYSLNALQIVHTKGEVLFSPLHLNFLHQQEDLAIEQGNATFDEEVLIPVVRQSRFMYVQVLALHLSDECDPFLLEIYVDEMLQKQLLDMNISVMDDTQRAVNPNPVLETLLLMVSNLLPHIGLQVFLTQDAFQTQNLFCSRNTLVAWDTAVTQVHDDNLLEIVNNPHGQESSRTAVDILDLPHSSLSDLANQIQLKSSWIFTIRSPETKEPTGFLLASSPYKKPLCFNELNIFRMLASFACIGITEQQVQHRIQADSHGIQYANSYAISILDNIHDGIVTINSYGEIISANRAIERLFSHPLNDILGHPLTILFPQFDFALLQHICNEPPENPFIFDNDSQLPGLKSTGESFPTHVQLSRIALNGHSHVVVNVHDISERLAQEQKILRLAFYDPLTELPNRRLLMDRLRQATSSSCRTGRYGAIMFLDLDHFKQLNDTRGHDVGDELLKQVAQRLQASIRESDSVARLGGDEFVILLSDLSVDFKEAALQSEIVARKVLNVLGEPYDLHCLKYCSTPSLGITLFVKDEETPETLLKRADVAMYQAKAAGRNTSRFFDQYLQDASSLNLEMEHDLRLALSRNEIFLYHQPQIDRDGLALGVETLMRWKSASKGMISPSVFIPLAEKLGLIHAMGTFALEAACKQSIEWSKDPNTAHWTVAVNVSAIQFSQENYVKTVEKVLKETGANPKSIKLELTESMLANDIESIIIKMKHLSKLGITFSLDDFGTGYSSLAYLKRLPISQLKIDQSFVHDVATNPSDAAIARTVVALGHSLGLNVIAEGVENTAQRDFLLTIGCDAFQGYLISSPVPAEQLTERLTASPIVTDWVA